MAWSDVFESGNNMMSAQGVAQHGADTWRCTVPRPAGRLPRLAAIGALGVLLPVLANCSREADRTPTTSSQHPALSNAPTAPKQAGGFSKIYSVGQTARGRGYSASVTRIVECRLEKGWHEKPGEFYLGVELLVQASGDTSVALGHTHTRLTDANQSAYRAEPIVMTQNCEPPFKYVRLDPGAAAKRWLVYSIPERARSLTLRLNPRPYLKEPELAFQLGR